MKNRGKITLGILLTAIVIGGVNVIVTYPTNQTLSSSFHPSCVETSKIPIKDNVSDIVVINSSFVYASIINADGTSKIKLSCVNTANETAWTWNSTIAGNNSNPRLDAGFNKIALIMDTTIMDTQGVSIAINYLMCFSDNGTLDWSNELDWAQFVMDVKISKIGIIVDDGMVASLYSYGGMQLWSFNAGLISAMAASSDFLVIGCIDLGYTTYSGILDIFNAKGTLLHSITLKSGTEDISIDAIMIAGMNVITCYTKHQHDNPNASTDIKMIESFNANTGSANWLNEGWCYAYQLYNLNNALFELGYDATFNFYFYCLDINTGDFKWNSSVPNSNNSVQIKSGIINDKALICEAMGNSLIIYNLDIGIRNLDLGTEVLQFMIGCGIGAVMFIPLVIVLKIWSVHAQKKRAREAELEERRKEQRRLATREQLEKNVEAAIQEYAKQVNPIIKAKKFCERNDTMPLEIVKEVLKNMETRGLVKQLPNVQGTVVYEVIGIKSMKKKPNLNSVEEQKIKIPTAQKTTAAERKAAINKPVSNQGDEKKVIRHETSHADDRQAKDKSKYPAKPLETTAIINRTILKDYIERQRKEGIKELHFIKIKNDLNIISQKKSSRLYRLLQDLVKDSILVRKGSLYIIV